MLARAHERVEEILRQPFPSALPSLWRRVAEGA
jgi:hypothetical protein